MNILILGSKGFIGKHCVAYFSKQHTIWQCDVAVDYTTANYIQIDSTNANYDEVFLASKFDVCINCSGAASVPDSIKNPRRDFMLNTVNVFQQLDALRKHNAECKYINFSSAAVYGNPKYLPIDEEHPLHPISPYGLHKKIAEDICQSFYNNYNIKTCSLRIFSAFGEGLKKQLFWDLHKKAIHNTEISLFGTGQESRDFVHVKDVVNAIELVINQSEFNHSIINIATGIETTIQSAVETFYKTYNSTVSIQFQGQIREGDPINWVADITKLQSLGFSSKMSLDRGMQNYVEWLRELK